MHLDRAMAVGRTPVASVAMAASRRDKPIRIERNRAYRFRREPYVAEERRQIEEATQLVHKPPGSNAFRLFVFAADAAFLVRC